MVGLNFGSKFQPRLCHSDKTLTRFQRLCTFGKSRAARRTFKRLGGVSGIKRFLNSHPRDRSDLQNYVSLSRPFLCGANIEQVTAVRSDQDRYHGKRRARRPLCRKLFRMGLFWEKAGGSTILTMSEGGLCDRPETDTPQLARAFRPTRAPTNLRLKRECWRERGNGSLDSWSAQGAYCGAAGASSDGLSRSRPRRRPVLRRRASRSLTSTKALHCALPISSACVAVAFGL